MIFWLIWWEREVFFSNYSIISFFFFAQKTVFILLCWMPDGRNLWTRTYLRIIMQPFDCQLWESSTQLLASFSTYHNMADCMSERVAANELSFGNLPPGKCAQTRMGSKVMGRILLRWLNMQNKGARCLCDVLGKDLPRSPQALSARVDHADIFSFHCFHELWILRQISLEIVESRLWKHFSFKNLSQI